MLVTGQSIVTQALTILGINSQGGIPSPSDSTDSLAELNAMWNAWGIDEGLIPAMEAFRFPLTAAYGKYSIGPGGMMNMPVIPQRAYSAAFCTAPNGGIAGSSLNNAGQGYAANDTGVVLGANGSLATYIVNTVGANGAVATYTITAAGGGYVPGGPCKTQTAGAQPGAGVGLEFTITSVATSTGETRTPLRIVESEEFFAHRDLGASALTPDEVYLSFNIDPVTGLATLYVYPINTGTAILELILAIPFLAWTLAGSYNIPNAYQDALQQALAWRLIPRFGAAVAQQVAEVVRENGMKAEERIRSMNAANRQRPELAPQPQQQRSPISTIPAAALQGVQPR